MFALIIRLMCQKPSEQSILADSIKKVHEELRRDTRKSTIDPTIL